MIITEKILLKLPVLYSKVIYDNLSDSVRNRQEYIIKALEEKFERDNIEYEFKNKIAFEGNIEDMPLTEDNDDL